MRKYQISIRFQSLELELWAESESEAAEKALRESQIKPRVIVVTIESDSCGGT